MGEAIATRKINKPATIQPRQHFPSFVKDGVRMGRIGSKRCFWVVKPSGDYGADCLTGQAMAEEYLHYARSDLLPLQWVVGDMQEIGGLEVGFLGAVGISATLGAATLLELKGSLVMLRKGP
jgi:hypothetical protein